jgi:hypothetical protein
MIIPHTNGKGIKKIIIHDENTSGVSLTEAYIILNRRNKTLSRKTPKKMPIRNPVRYSKVFNFFIVVTLRKIEWFYLHMRTVISSICYTPPVLEQESFPSAREYKTAARAGRGAG